MTKVPIGCFYHRTRELHNSHLEKNIDFAYAPKIKKLDLLLSKLFKMDNFLDDNEDNFTDIPFSERLSLFNQWNFKRKKQKVSLFLEGYQEEEVEV